MSGKTADARGQIDQGTAGRIFFKERVLQPALATAPWPLSRSANGGCASSSPSSSRSSSPRWPWLLACSWRKAERASRRAEPADAALRRRLPRRATDAVAERRHPEPDRASPERPSPEDLEVRCRCLQAAGARGCIFADRCRGRDARCKSATAAAHRPDRRRCADPPLSCRQSPRNRRSPSSPLGHGRQAYVGMRARNPIPAACRYLRSEADVLRGLEGQRCG